MKVALNMGECNCDSSRRLEIAALVAPPPEGMSQQLFISWLVQPLAPDDDSFGNGTIAGFFTTGWLRLFFRFQA